MNSLPVTKTARRSDPSPLPDNITDWRLQQRREGQNGRGQHGHAFASKPFYLLPLVTESYLTEDDLTAAVGYSTLEQTSQPVNCTVSLLDLSGTVLDSKQVTLSKGKKSGVNFGKQPQGSYQISLSHCGEYSDMVLLPVQVNPTNRKRRGSALTLTGLSIPSSS